MVLAFQIFREFLIILFFPVIAFTDLFTHKEGVKNRGSNVTIVIVERWFYGNILHLLWKKYLERKGYRVYLLNFYLFRGTFEDSAKQLGDFIEKEELKDVVLVGISGGGFTCLSYLQDYGGWEKTRKFIAVGTPFRGTPFALSISLVKAGRELLPGSDLVKRVKEMKIKNLNKIVCIRAKHEAIVPSSSNYLEGAKSIVINVFGHNSLHMVTKKTYDEIALLASK